MSTSRFDPYAYAAQGASTSDDDPLAARAAEDAPAPAPAPTDHQLSVSLPASSWEAITTLLGGYPYSQVAELISAIQGQTGSQLLMLIFMGLPVNTAKQ